MKKIIFSIAIVLTLGFTASAQRGSDGFFGYNDFDNNDRFTGALPAMPGTGIGDTGNATAPLGTGLLIMTALGAGYAVARKKR